MNYDRNAVGTLHAKNAVKNSVNLRQTVDFAAKNKYTE